MVAQEADQPTYPDYYTSQVTSAMEEYQLSEETERLPIDVDGGWDEAAREFYWKSLRAWAENYLWTETGVKISVKTRPWMRQIWDEETGLVVLQKPTQVWATTWAYSLALHRAAVRGQVGIFTMPTAADARDFVSGRLDRVIDNSPLLAHLMQREPVEWGVVGPRRRRTHIREVKDNTSIKHMGRGTLYFRGTQTRRGAVSVPAHFLIHDELDLSVPEVLEMYQHRLDNVPPEEWQIYYISTPTIPNFGVNARYRNSTGYVWLVKCEGCNVWQSLNYWTHTRGVEEVLRCPHCQGVLDPMADDPKRACWVDEHPDKQGHTAGYKLSRLMLCSPDDAGRNLLRKMHERRREARFERHFTNMDLGETSSEGAFTFSREALLAACFTQSAYPYPQAEWERRMESMTGPHYMGIDQGDTLTITVGRMDPIRDEGRIRVVLCERRRDPQRGSDAWRWAAELMDRYQIAMCVVDGQPNSAPAHDLAKKYPGRVMVCYYKSGQRFALRAASDVEKAAEAGGVGLRSGMVSMKVDDTTRVDITVERTEALDVTGSDLVAGAFMLPSQATNLHPEVEELLIQVENNVRRPIEDKRTEEVLYRWDRKGPNDYFHSLNYLRIARDEGQRLRSLSGNYRAPVGVWGAQNPSRPPSTPGGLGRIKGSGLRTS